MSLISMTKTKHCPASSLYQQPGRGKYYCRIFCIQKHVSFIHVAGGRITPATACFLYRTPTKAEKVFTAFSSVALLVFILFNQNLVLVFGTTKYLQPGMSVPETTLPTGLPAEGMAGRHMPRRTFYIEHPPRRKSNKRDS